MLRQITAQFINNEKRTQSRFAVLKRRGIVYGIAGFTIGVAIVLVGQWLDAQILHSRNDFSALNIPVDSVLHAVIFMLPIVLMLLGVVIGRLVDAEMILIRQRNFWFELVDMLGEGVTFNDIDGKIRFVNKRYADIIGIEREDLIGKTSFELVPPESREILYAAWKELQNGQASQYMLQVQSRTKGNIQVHVSGVPWKVDGVIQGTIAVVHDRTEEIALQQQLRYEHQFLHNVLDTADILVIVCSQDGRIRTFNRACQVLTGYSAEAIQGTMIWDHVLKPIDVEQLQAVFEHICATQTTVRIEHDWRTQNGDDRSIAWTYTALIDQHDMCIVGTGIDITDQRSYERKNQQLLARLQGMATTDALTSVANRHQLSEMGTMYAASASPELPVSILLIDADHFKAVNDTYGHSVGDDVLRQLAHRLRRLIRAHDIVGRFGGEEFMLILPSANASAARMVAERARRMIANSPIKTEGGSITLTISIGIASTTEPLPYDQLLNQADVALYLAKERGRNCVVSSEEALVQS